MTLTHDNVSPGPTTGQKAGNLLTAIASGDTVAFGLLHQAWAGKLSGTVLRILRDRAQTEEVIQDLFLEVWLHADRFQADKGSAAGYLRRLATSRAIDRVRASQTHRDYTLHAGTEHFYANTAALTRVHDDWALRHDVRQSLTHLTFLQREVIELAYFQELTHVEIADRLRVPVGTVKSRINSALTSLRRNR
ncbi:hypothetical protein AX769_21055 (plasmid) [Frondihabitans sp. PAMC 28766]|nr:hypothetical protein AX769_21055 [Frondihabitans sp. PAMC 28766]